jgi:hypothetical protein
MNRNKTYIQFLLLVFTILIADNCKAQYSFSPSTTLIRYQDCNMLSYDSIHIVNNSNETLNLRWELLQFDTLDGSSFDFCSSGNCWLGIPVSGSFPAIVPGGFGFAGVHIWTGNVPATCTAKIWVYKDGFYTTGDTLTYILHALSVSGIGNYKEPENLISVYPNPAKDKITILSASELPEEISISLYNMFGEVIYTSSFLNSSTGIPLDNVSNGIYLLYINTANKNYVKKIVVSR